MAPFVKQLAPRQLLAAGSEGLYSPPPNEAALAAAFARSRAMAWVGCGGSPLGQ